MSQKEPRWSQEKLAALQTEQKYLKLGGRGGKLVLSGAVGRWKKGAQDIYVPALRVAGTPAEITALVVEIGGTPAQAQQYIAAGYSAANYNTTMKAAFDAEVAAYKASRPAATRRAAAPTVDLAELPAIMAGLDSAFKSFKEAKKAEKKARKSPKKAKKAAKRKSPRKRKSPKKAKKAAKRKSPRKRKSPLKGKSRKSLAERLAALPAGKVLDASGIQRGGLGIKTIKAPGAKSKKRGAPGLALVADTKAKFTRALKALGPEYEVYAAQYGQAVFSPAASPVASPVAGSPLPPLAASPALSTLPVIAGGSPLAGGMGLPTLPTVASPIGSPIASPRL